jgi:hypothetical protein
LSLYLADPILVLVLEISDRLGLGQYIVSETV